MKIIQHGTQYAIIIQCTSCGCVYCIESYKDWQGRWENNLLTGQKCYNYLIRCPECNHLREFGWHPYEHGNQGIGCQNGIFYREDWKERYSIDNLEDAP